jgi:hypothetical protein
VHTKTLHQKTFSIFQLQSWIYNCYTRHFVETLCCLAFFCILFYNIMLFVGIVRMFNIPLDTTQSVAEQTSVEYEWVISFTDYYFLPLMLLIGMQSIILFTYKLKTKKLIVFEPRVPFDFGIFGTAVVLRIRFLGTYDELFADGDLTYLNMWTVFTFCLAIRVFLCFSIDSNFGPILRMLYATLIDISSFLMVFLMILLAFTLTYHQLFYKSPGYETIQSTATTLVSAALGSFDLNAFVDREELGYALLSVWIVIATILILNVLIAFLSRRYEEMAPQTTADYVSLLFVYIQSTKFTPEYGGLVMFPLPFTIFLIPFVPLYFLPVDKQRLSANLAKLSYLPMLLVAVICFALHCVVMSLCSYFKNSIILAVELNTRLHKRVRNLAKWGFVGPFYLTYLS